MHSDTDAKKLFLGIFVFVVVSVLFAFSGNILSKPIQPPKQIKKISPVEITASQIPCHHVGF